MTNIPVLITVINGIARAHRTTNYYFLYGICTYLVPTVVAITFAFVKKAKEIGAVPTGHSVPGERYRTIPRLDWSPDIQYVGFEGVIKAVFVYLNLFSGCGCMNAHF